MHAYLIVGKTESKREKKAQEIASGYGTIHTILLEPTNNIYTIRSVRELTHDLSLKSPQTRCVFIYNAHQMTEEASNAFLKTLEEPGENIIYILTSPNLESVLETIASRCEAINIGTSEVELSDEEKEQSLANFEKLSKEVGEKFKFVDKVSDRDEAMRRVIGQIFAVREKMLKSAKKGVSSQSDRVQISVYSDILNRLLNTKKDLEQNVNIKLTLTELLLSYPPLE